MKPTVTLVLLAALALTAVSCRKETISTPDALQQQNTGALKCTTPTPCGTPVVATLRTTQRQTAGSVTVSNDATNLYVTYTATGGYRLEDLRLYVGDLALLPVRYGQPVVSQFPYGTHLTGTVTSYTYTIPLAALGSCFSVMAEATVRTNWCSSQTAWAGSIHYGASCSSAYYLSYCRATCTSDTCMMPVQLLYSGEAAWPNGDANVTVGGYTYTKSDAVSMYYTPDCDSKKALLLIAALKVYGPKITVPASVTADATTVENWLSRLGQLTQFSQYTASATVETAINNVDTWETSHTCH
ncbi:MAG: hypothetical protein JST90_16815 [Bacteroidetes bacterium]|nr:hypothetical protein [Bacteroidota bacterium]